MRDKIYEFLFIPPPQKKTDLCVVFMLDPF